jgi:hypothetical protein
MKPDLMYKSGQKLIYLTVLYQEVCFKTLQNFSLWRQSQDPHLILIFF